MKSLTYRVMYTGRRSKIHFAEKAETNAWTLCGLLVGPDVEEVLEPHRGILYDPVCKTCRMVRKQRKVRAQALTEQREACR